MSVTGFTQSGARSALAPWGVAFDDPQFTGASDDIIRVNVMSYAASQTVPPVILLAARHHTWHNAFDLYDGCALHGVPARGNAELSSHAGCVKTTVTTDYSGVAFDGSGGGAYSSTYVQDVSIRNIQFLGGSSTQWMGCGSGSAIHGGELRDLGFSGFQTVLGSQSQHLGFTTSYIDGFDINNSYNGAIHVAGSDNVFFEGHCNIDSPTSALSTYSATGQAHVWFDYLEKTKVGPMYITCEGGWAGLLVTGPSTPGAAGGNSNNGGPIWIYGAKIEGRNAGAPCDGANVRIQGGILNLRDSWVGYGMSTPSTMGHSPTDAGMIHQTGGTLLVDGVTYDHASGVAESVPFLYQNGSGSIARISNQSIGSKGGSWSGLPQVHSAAGSLNADSSVTVV